MGRTRTGNVWHVRHDIPDGLTREIGVLCRSEPLAKRLMRPPRIAAAIRASIQTGGPLTREYRGPAYLIPEGAQTHTGALLITTGNSHLLEIGFPWIVSHIMADVDIGPVTATVVNGRAVSICYCARLSPLAAEAGVETVEGMRGKGYATAAVEAWAAATRERGLLPLYSTSWENVASRRLAQKLEMVCYGEDWEIE